MAVFMRRLLSDSPKKYCFSKVSLTSEQSLTSVDFEMPFPEARHKIVGYCNGLFCVEYADGKIVVWNPSNKSFQEVPSPANSISPSPSPSPLLGKGKCCLYDESWTPHTIFLVCGFGHDINTDDYKVIVHIITYFDVGDGGINSGTGFVRQAFVYSLVEEGKWKEIPYPRDLHSVGVMDASGTSINGCCYWTAEAVGEHTYPRVCILSLDLATLEFSLVELPDYLPFLRISELKLITLVELEGTLSLISLQNVSFYMKSWVWMGRLGWRSKHNHVQLYGAAQNGMPLGYLNENFMLFQSSTGAHLLIYNTTTEMFGGVDLIQDRRRSMRLFPYVESTLHLNNSFS